LSVVLGGVPGAAPAAGRAGGIRLLGGVVLGAHEGRMAPKGCGRQR
jgi:hypothetical protein